MKKLFFVMVLMLAFALPSTADMTVPVSAGGGIGPYCNITGTAVDLGDLGGPNASGWQDYPGEALVSTNVPATIYVSIASPGGPDTIYGTVSKHSLKTKAYWGAPVADPATVVSPSSQAVPPPKDGDPYAYTVSVLRADLEDPEDEYTGTITLAITCK